MRAEELRVRLAEAGLLVRWPEGAVPEELTAVAVDSRRVAPGTLFVACRGTASDGHDFVAAAARSGAGAALVERGVPDAGVPLVEVRDGRRAAAAAAALHHGDPARSLELVAVTGTNGKTTTAALLRHLLGDRESAGSIGTVGAMDGSGAVLPGTGSLTTPGPVELQAVLAALRDSGVRRVAMEVSSHSLDQERVHGLSFRAAVFTNLTRDHLDYHGDEAAYLAAKLRLQAYLEPGGWVVFNAADPAWRALDSRAERRSFGVEVDADVRAERVEGAVTGMRFSLCACGLELPAQVPLLGRFNVENALGAAATALALGWEPRRVVERLRSSPQVPGRMERLADRPCPVLRDYAHTPDALERALAALRPLTHGRLLVLLGCGGDRDRGKRPLMGAVAVRAADLVIVTSDNPRTEDPERILDDIEAGMGSSPHLRIVDRRQAIARALSIGKEGDTILLAGKGHETYQVLGTERVAFDEAVVVRELLEGRAQ